MDLNFEQAEKMIPAQRKDEIARLLWRENPLPENLTAAEKIFAFGLYTFIEYEDKEQLKNYFLQD